MISAPLELVKRMGKGPALALGLFAMQACAPLAVQSPPPQSSSVALQSLEQRVVQGRIKVQVLGDYPQVLSASFELRGTAQNGSLHLLSPLGTTVAQLVWTPQFAQLQQPTGIEVFPELPSLLEKVTGARLPVGALFDWLAGKGLQGFSDAGWHAYGASNGGQRLQLERVAPAPAVRLTVILDENA